jgi:hypothetical protein
VHRPLPNAQLAFELLHLGRERGTDRLHCLRSRVGIALDGRAYLLDVLPAASTSSASRLKSAASVRNAATIESMSAKAIFSGKLVIAAPLFAAVPIHAPRRGRGS